MEHQQMQAIIENYIAAYNQFDIDGMTRHLDPNIEFRNWVDGEVTHAIMGVQGFKLQAEEAAQYFSAREQKPTQYNWNGDTAEVAIDYTGVLAVELPNGLQPGEQLQLKGKSVFTFEDGQIIRIEDFS